MQAKYDGKCTDCGGRFYAGDEIRWSRAQGARHAERGVCDSYFEQHAEMKAEEAFAMRVTGAWAYNSEYGGYEGEDW